MDLIVNVSLRSSSFHNEHLETIVIRDILAKEGEEIIEELKEKIDETFDDLDGSISVFYESTKNASN